MFDFSQRVVMVTGGSGNLGSMVVQRFQAAGAKLIVPDRALDRLAGQFPELAASPDHYLVGGIDLAQPEAVERMVQGALDRFGRIDVLVNTVGGYRAGTPVHETPLETWDFMMELNARTTFIVCHAVVPSMLAQGYGKIINISSPSANSGSANASAYSAAKSAVARLTESMAAEYKRAGLNINAVLPGTLDTPPNREAMPNADRSRWVTTDALADVILFLASDMASAVQGALIPATGRG